MGALGVFQSKSGLCGGFVWARRARNSQKRRSPARAVLRMIGYCELMAAGVCIGAHDRPSPSFMGLASLGLEIGVFCLSYIAFSY